MRSRVADVRRKLSAPFRLLRGRDLALYSAAVTFYAGIAVVPVALLAIWITGLIAGADRVRRLTGHTIDALPDAIGAPRALAALIEAGLHLTPMLAIKGVDAVHIGPKDLWQSMGMPPKEEVDKVVAQIAAAVLASGKQLSMQFQFGAVDDLSAQITRYQRMGALMTSITLLNLLLKEGAAFAKKMRTRAS